MGAYYQIQFISGLSTPNTSRFRPERLGYVSFRPEHPGYDLLLAWASWIWLFPTWAPRMTIHFWPKHPGYVSFRPEHPANDLFPTWAPRIQRLRPDYQIFLLLLIHSGRTWIAFSSHAFTQMWNCAKQILKMNVKLFLAQTRDTDLLFFQHDIREYQHIPGPARFPHGLSVPLPLPRQGGGNFYNSFSRNQRKSDYSI